MTRIERLRKQLAWSQSGMASYLGVSQPTIANIESGKKESGPIARLLDQLERALESKLATPGMTPSEIIGAIPKSVGSCDKQRTRESY
jgi:transcriptional regulator with XRE-family HTH domain